MRENVQQSGDWGERRREEKERERERESWPWTEPGIDNDHRREGELPLGETHCSVPHSALVTPFFLSLSFSLSFFPFPLPQCVYGAALPVVLVLRQSRLRTVGQLMEVSQAVVCLRSVSLCGHCCLEGEQNDSRRWEKKKKKKNNRPKAQQQQSLALTTQ